MDIDRVYIESISSKTGFQRDTLEKVHRLIDLLVEVNKDSELRRNLILKGGTAINFMYFDLPRLSVDLDFNFTGAIAKKDMEKRRPALEKKIENILQFKGYKFEVDASAYGSTKISVKYINNAGNADKIKIDINYLLRVSISPNILKGFTAPFESTVEKVNTLLAEELFGEKLLALMSRKAPRDLYDVYNLVNSTINLDLSALRKIFIFLGCVGRKDFREYSPNDILSITSMDLKTGLYPFLRKGDRPSIEDLFKVTAPFLESLFRFDKQENRFIQDFFNGTPNIELLFSDFKNVSNLISHPMLIWKQKHLKEFLAKKT